MILMIVHPFPPLYDENSQILILGSFPSVKSREAMFFYGHPQNRFWKVASRIFGAPVPETIDEKKNAVPNDLSEIFKKADIKHIFVNGKTAEKYYNKYTKDTVGKAAVCLPSTSPANAAWTVERVVKAWEIIKA